MAEEQASTDDGFHAEGFQQRAYLLWVKAGASFADLSWTSGSAKSGFLPVRS